MNTAYAVWPWPPLFTILCTCYWLITTHPTYSTTSLSPSSLPPPSPCRSPRLLLPSSTSSPPLLLPCRTRVIAATTPAGAIALTFTAIAFLARSYAGHRNKTWCASSSSPKHSLHLRMCRGNATCLPHTVTRSHLPVSILSSKHPPRSLVHNRLCCTCPCCKYGRLGLPLGTALPLFTS